MKDIKQLVADTLKNPKILVIIGLCGILLIALSSFFGGKKEEKTEAAPTPTLTAAEYKEALQLQIKSAVCPIVGERVNVVITLNSDIEYVYASEGKSQSSEQSESSNKKIQKGSGAENSYVIMKDSSGNETPLVITAVMPSVKGAVINCEGGDDPAVSAAVRSVVTTALDIDEEKVCVTGYYE